jgi:hypothetical protein
MALNVRLQTSDGEVLEQVEDPRNALARLLPPEDENGSALLAFIDRYGDTIFNRPQMRPFIKEWQLVLGRARSEEDRHLVTRIDGMARKCQEEPHLYLRFIGD